MGSVQCLVGAIIAAGGVAVPAPAVPLSDTLDRYTMALPTVSWLEDPAARAQFFSDWDDDLVEYAGQAPSDERAAEAWRCIASIRSEQSDWTGAAAAYWHRSKLITNSDEEAVIENAAFLFSAVTKDLLENGKQANLSLLGPIYTGVVQAVLQQQPPPELTDSESTVLHAYGVISNFAVIGDHANQFASATQAWADARSLLNAASPSVSTALTDLKITPALCNAREARVLARSGDHQAAESLFETTILAQDDGHEFASQEIIGIIRDYTLAGQATEFLSYSELAHDVIPPGRPILESALESTEAFVRPHEAPDATDTAIALHLLTAIEGIEAELPALVAALDAEAALALGASNTQRYSLAVNTAKMKACYVVGDDSGAGALAIQILAGWPTSEDAKLAQWILSQLAG